MSDTLRDRAIATVPVPACYLCGTEGRRVYAGLRDTWLGVPGVWNLRRCGRCRLVWLDPRPERKDLPKLYGDGYYTHSPPPEVGPREAGILRRIVRRATRLEVPVAAGGDRAEPPRVERLLANGLRKLSAVRDVAYGSVMWLHGSIPGRLLDVGCGDGSFLALMRGLGWEVEGVEPDPIAARVAALHHGLRVTRATIEEASSALEVFDVVTMSHVIEHVPDPVEALRACGRLLKRDGRVVVVTPNTRSMGRFWFRRQWNGWEVPRHLFVFSPRSLRACAERAGLEVHELRTTARTVFRMLPSMRAHTRLLGRSASGSHAVGTSARIPALAFWSLEHLLLRVSPSGEEILMVARRAR